MVTLRVFGELAFRVTDAATLLARLTGTGGTVDDNGVIASWVVERVLAAIRVVLPDLVATHGVLAMGQLQDATAAAATARANEQLASYGLAVTTFAELNVNLPDADAQQLKQFAATRAYTGAAGSFDEAVRGEAVLTTAQGVASGGAAAQPAVMAGMMLGVPVGAPGVPPTGPVAAPTGVAPGGPVAAPAAPGEAHFCAQCGAALPAGAHFCPGCGASVAAVPVTGSAAAPPGGTVGPGAPAEGPTPSGGGGAVP